MEKQCSDDALSLIKDDLNKHLKRGNSVDTRNIEEICADLFTEILRDLAKGESKGSEFVQDKE